MVGVAMCEQCSSPLEGLGTTGLKLLPQLTGGLAAVGPACSHLAVLMAVDQGDNPAHDLDLVARDISALNKREHLRVIAQAVLAGGVGHGWGRNVVGLVPMQQSYTIRHPGQPLP